MVLEAFEAIGPLGPNPQRQLDQIRTRLRSQIASPAPVEVRVDLRAPS